MIPGALVDDRSSLSHLLDNSDDYFKAFIREQLKLIEGNDMEEKEQETYLKSTHMILYKLSDYVSLPNLKFFSFREIFNSLGSIIFGSRLQDKNGFYLQESHSRFLFIFHDIGMKSVLSRILKLKYVIPNHIYFILSRVVLSRCECVNDICRSVYGNYFTF